MEGFFQPRNHYDFLCVSRDATAAEIRKAFLKLSLKFHPDKNKEEGSEERFKLINYLLATHKTFSMIIDTLLR